MGSEAEPADGPSSAVLKLPLLSIPQGMQSPEHPGMLTPPIQTYASVPFRWEEEPGKPRPCTDLIPLPSPNTNTDSPRSLELPPRLLMPEYSKIFKTPSPTTVLDGPYGESSNKSTKPMFSSSSFRFIRELKVSSFRSSCASPESGQLGYVVLGNGKIKHKDRGLFRFWGQKTRGKKDVGEGGFVFSSSMDGAESGSSTSARVNKARIRRNGSFSRLSQPRSHLWAAIYGGLKQAIPWSKKPKKGLSRELSISDNCIL